MKIELPYPPSVNHLWRRVGCRMYLSQGGRAFRRAVQAALAEQGVRPIAGRLAVTIVVHPPDRRRRDLDNVLKALLDALQHGGAYHDDAQIDILHVRRDVCAPGGRVHARLIPRPTSELGGPVGPPEPGPDSAKPRTCLKCGKQFSSTWAGNRICSPCGVRGRLRGEHGAALSESQLSRQRGAKRRKGSGEIVSGGGGD